MNFNNRSNMGDDDFDLGKNVPNQDLIFQKEGIIDVTNFDVMKLGDPLGYMCSCTVSVYSTGRIEICSIGKENVCLESLSVLDVIRSSNNINNYDPEHLTEVSITTDKKNLHLTFKTAEDKNSFWNVFTQLYKNDR